MPTDEVVFDTWTPLSFKWVLRTGHRAGTPGVAWQAPIWVGRHARRLQAYKVLQAYRDNSSRFFLNTLDDDIIDKRREYGDAELIVSTIVDAVLGDGQTFHVDGAELDEPRAVELQDYLRQWAKDERWAQHVLETETDAVTLGDGVYVFAWSSKSDRPTVRSYDPGFYFPVEDEEDQSEQGYPRRVHIAWEEEHPDPTKIQVRRIAWTLAPIRPLTDEEGYPLLDSDGRFLLRDGDRQDPETFQITRRLPWRDEPVTETCYMTDATWVLERYNVTVDDFSAGTAIYQFNEDGDLVKDLDLGFDFIPVVHLTNTVALRNGYGKSSLATVLQILDDLMATDTDLQAASATTGSPPIAIQGGSLEGVADGKLATYGPGTVFESGDGRATLLDTSRSLDALLKYTEQLLERLSINARVPQAAVGRVKPSEVPSGIALVLGFSPLESMVRRMRLARDEKYPICLKFVLRLAMLGKKIPAGELPTAHIEFGSYLPSDKMSTVQHVTLLLQNGAISLLTAVQMLIEGGFSIDDAAREVERIREEAAEKARLALEQAQALAATEPDDDDDDVRTEPGDKKGPPRPQMPERSSPVRGRGTPPREQ